MAADEKIEAARAELEAMGAIIDALEPLETDEQRRRVVAAALCLHSTEASDAALATLIK